MDKYALLWTISGNCQVGIIFIGSLGCVCRCGQTFGAERHEKELLVERPPAERSAAQQRLILFLGEAGEAYSRFTPAAFPGVLQLTLSNSLFSIATSHHFL
jgi:hypothetical protein